VYKLFDDPKEVEKYLNATKSNFKAKNPGFYHGLEITFFLIKELLIFICFIIFFIMVIVADKNLINWIY